MCNWKTTECGNYMRCAMMENMSKNPSVFRVDHKVAVVVGAACGIGRATAAALSESGAAVVCADVDLAGAESTASQISDDGGTATALRLDITDAKSIDPAIEQAK